MIIKIYGERNTGTNYLMQLIENNIPIVKRNGSAYLISSANSSVDLDKTGELGWKHRLASAEYLQAKGVGRGAVLIVTLTKNPYSWLLSLHKRPYCPLEVRTQVIARKAAGVPVFQKWIEKLFLGITRRLGRPGLLLRCRFPQWCEYVKLTFYDFIRNTWFSECQGEVTQASNNPVQLWNEKNKAYLALAEHYNVLLLTYEELLAFPEATLRKITDRLGCKMSHFNNLDRSAKNEDKENNAKNHQYYKDYYLNECWRERLNKKEIKWISSQLDPLVMKSFGYELL
ncbi:MAG: sulfotransferase domain-containing protein [Pseudomonadota bacterium]